MSLEILTKEAVEQAHRLEGVTHPLLSVVGLHAPRIIDADSNETLRQERLCDFVDDVEVIGDFPLEPLHLVALWSAASQQRLLPHARDVAMIVALAYSTVGLESPTSRRLPRYILEHGNLPESLQNDQEGLRHILTRLDTIGESLDSLEIYVHGRKGAIEYTIQLARNIGRGDDNALTEFRNLKAYQEEHQTPIIAAVMENFGTAQHSLHLMVEHHLEHSS